MLSRVQRRRVGKAGALGVTVALLLATLAPFSFGQEPPTAEAGLRRGASTRTASRQFEVYAETLDLRSAFSSFADEVRSNFLAVTGLSGVDAGLIVIKVSPPVEGRDGMAPFSVKPRISHVGSGKFHYQLDVNLGQDFQRNVARNELVRLLLAEQILRGQADVPKGRSELLPEWFFVGITEAIAQRETGGVDARRFQVVLQSGRLMPPRELLQVERSDLDTNGREVFDASACSLLLALRQQSNSGESIRGFVRALGQDSGSGESPRALLLRHFPGLSSSPASLEKWWTMQVAAMAEPEVLDTWDPVRSEQQMEGLLVFEFRQKEDETEAVDREGDGEGPAGDEAPPSEDLAGVMVTRREVPVTDYAEILDRPDRAEIALRTSRNLALAKLRVFPPLRPVIDGYLTVFRQIAEGDVEDVDAQLVSLLELRGGILAKATAIEHYLDWYEATASDRQSGDFDDYFRVMRSLARPLAPRGDAITNYLDAMEQEWE